jgi:ACR3 family arsenite transporter
VLYVVIPLVAGFLTRKMLNAANDTTSQPSSSQRLDSFLARLKPFSIIGLLGTVALLFGFQAKSILEQPLIIVLIAIPLLVQTYLIFALAYAAAKMMKLSHSIAAPACLIGTSNFFELAVAVAISLFGLNSGAALATVVGVLVEVPVMLSLVAFINRTRHWFFDEPDQTTR